MLYNNINRDLTDQTSKFQNSNLNRLDPIFSEFRINKNVT